MLYTARVSQFVEQNNPLGLGIARGRIGSSVVTM